MLNFLYHYTQLGEVVNMDITDSTDLSNLKRFINEAYKDFQNKFQWKWKEKTGFMQTVKVKISGTVTVTADSRTVTGSSTAFASGDVGKYFNADSDDEWYEIIAVASTTSMTLRRPYIRATASGGTYNIYKKYYTLNPDVDELIDIYLAEGYPRQLKNVSPREAPNSFSGWVQGDPHLYRPYDVDRTVTTYSTGTVAGTINTRTLTGTSTVWLDNVFPGDKVTIGTNIYNVQSVDADTQITISQNLMATSTTDTYTAIRKNLKRVEFDATPKEYNTNLNYTYYQKTYNMVNDNDEMETPDKYSTIVMMKAKALAYAHLDDTREQSELAAYEAMVNNTIKIEVSKRSQPQHMTWQK